MTIMKRVGIIASILSIISAFVLFQTAQISQHHANKYEINVANIYSFLEHFDLLFVSRTLKHEKGIFYWFDWIDNEAGLVTMNQTMSLLHFDVHGIEDNSDEPIHVCTAPNLFVYDFFVKQVLDIAYSAYFNDFDPKQNANVTRHALRKGYVRDIVWIYPNHWLNYSQKLAMNTSFTLFQEMIYYQTFYINPKKRKLLYLQNNASKEKDELWKKLFDTNNLFQSVQNKLDSFDNLEINIWTLSLTQYLNEAYFKSLQRNNMIIDIDLDFFRCQEPAQTFMNYFDWNAKLMVDFNNILAHHQYIPSHMFSEYSNEALLTLLYLLNENKTETQQLDADNEEIANIKFNKMPQIEDVFRIGIEEKLEIPTMKRVMYLLFEYQMQRSLYHNNSVQHLMHFDDIFKILNIAHRRLVDIEIVGYKDSNEALHGIKVSNSHHMDHLFKIAQKEAKNEYFMQQRMETIKIGNIIENNEETFKQFEEFATKLIAVNEHRNLLSTEIDEMGKEKEIHNGNNEEMMLEMEWNDEQLKDLMNMTTDYLYDDWNAILFDKSNDKETKSWKYKYPQWLSKQMDDTDEILNFPPNTNGYRNKDHSEMHTKISDIDSIEKQSQFVLRFDDLDPLQKHFLHRAKHAKLKSFVDKLNAKQHIFLKWLIFCYYHQMECRGRKYLPNTFNKSRHFGYDFVWHEINGWPQLIENDAKSEILQIEIGRYHSQFTTFIDAEADEISFMPNSKDMQKTLNEFERLISAQNAKIITVGIELSAGHIAEKHRHSIECKIYKLIENTMFVTQNKQERKPCFVRLKKMQNDHIVPYLPCSIIL